MCVRLKQIGKLNENYWVVEKIHQVNKTIKETVTFTGVSPHIITINKHTTIADTITIRSH